MTSPGSQDPRRNGASLVGVGGPDLAEVRQRVTASAQRVGLDADRAAEFTIAVNEAMINAIQHAGGSADVTITTTGRTITVEIRDRGPGLSSGIERELPPSDQPGGRGLWLIRQLCDQVTVHTSPVGTLIRMTTTANGPDAEV